MPRVEFVYNKVVHLSTHYSPFDIVYGFNPLTPLDLSHFPMGEQVNLDGVRKADFVRNLHKKVKQNIER